MKKLGVYIATHENPIFIRLCLLQLEAQTVQPNVIAVHENGHRGSFRPLVSDILERFTRNGVKILWKHTLEKIKHPAIYKPCIEMLLAADCEMFTKFDHDDFFYDNHIECLVAHLEREGDIAVNALGEIVVVVPGASPIIKPLFNFDGMNPTHGMADCLIFNRGVAEEYVKDMAAAEPGTVDDVTLGKTTMPKFKINSYKAPPTAAYVFHGANTSGAHISKEFILARKGLEGNANTQL